MLEDCDPGKVDRSVTQPGAGSHGLRRHLGYAGAGTAIVLGGALGYVGLVDPHDPASIYPPCPFKLLTGWNCPFCGGLRMTYDVVHGDLTAALHDNVFVLVGIPMLVLWLVVRRARGAASVPRAALVTAVAAAVVWTVLRNLPAFPLIPTVLGG